MSGTYGFHPTIYGGKEDMELYALFRRESWEQLGEASRQQLFQEVVNRAAQENGEKGSCKVEFADLGPNVAGEQGGGVIYLNRTMYAQDLRAVNYGGRLMTVPYTSSNLEALNTVLHEDQHAYQCQLLDVTIQPQDPNQVWEYAANDFTPVPLPQPDGSVKLGSTYLQGETYLTGRYLYYFQSTERDAHLVAERKTLAVVDALEAKYGTEPSFEEYRQEVAVNGYDAMLAEAQRLFQNPEVERDINRSLMNHYHGTKLPVDPKVEAVMQEEMAASYEAQHRLELTEEQTASEKAETAAQTETAAREEEAAPAQTGYVGPFDIVIETQIPAEAPRIVQERPALQEAPSEPVQPAPPSVERAPGVESAAPSVSGPAAGGPTTEAPSAGPSHDGGVEDDGGIE